MGAELGFFPLRGRGLTSPRLPLLRSRPPPIWIVARWEWLALNSWYRCLLIAPRRARHAELLLRALARHSHSDEGAHRGSENVEWNKRDAEVGVTRGNRGGLHTEMWNISVPFVNTVVYTQSRANSLLAFVSESSPRSLRALRFLWEGVIAIRARPSVYERLSSRVHCGMPTRRKLPPRHPLATLPFSLLPSSFNYILPSPFYLSVFVPSTCYPSPWHRLSANATSNLSTCRKSIKVFFFKLRLES